MHLKVSCHQKQRRQVTSAAEPRLPESNATRDIEHADDYRQNPGLRYTGAQSGGAWYLRLGSR